MNTIISNDTVVTAVINLMSSVISEKQLETLKYVLDSSLCKYKIIQEDNSLSVDVDDNDKIIKLFLATKKLSGSSNGTIQIYKLECTNFLQYVNKNYRDVTTNDVRVYMAHKKIDKNVSNTTMNNTRQYLMSFFKFLTTEEYIDKNPMLRIEPIKTDEKIRTILTPKQTEIIRCDCRSERDLAIIEMFLSTGIRVSEMIRLNITDIDFNKSECIVYGKRRKERLVFLNAKAIVHIKKYIDSRTDENEALFVSKKKPNNRLSSAGIRSILKQIIKDDDDVKGIRLHPHAFRYTFATDLINREVPAEHVQILLGHKSIDTTLKCYGKIYASTVKRTFDRYIN